MQASAQLRELVEVITWIDQNTTEIDLPADERSLLAIGCFDVAIEHQAAIALLSDATLYGSSFALLRVLAESLVRGLWLLHCANDDDLARFKRGKIGKSFSQLIDEFESKIDTPSGVLTNFRLSAWTTLNGFTHTGFHQISRRHLPGKVQGNYAEQEIAKALGLAGALGFIAASQLISLSSSEERMSLFVERIKQYAKTTA